MPIPSMSLAVVGMVYPNKKGGNRQFEIAMCSPGEPVELRPEPRNPADPNAIAVFSCRGVQMGYITAERAPWMSKIIGEGREVRAIFQNSFPQGAWIRAAFDGQEPVLPPMGKTWFIPDRKVGAPAEGADPESGFWPDEEFPEE